MKEVRGWISEEIAQEFYKIEVKSKEDLEELSNWLDTPILLYRGCKAVLDVKDKLLFYKIQS